MNLKKCYNVFRFTLKVKYFLNSHFALHNLLFDFWCWSSTQQWLNKMFHQKEIFYTYEAFYSFYESQVIKHYMMLNFESIAIEWIARCLVYWRPKSYFIYLLIESQIIKERPSHCDIIYSAFFVTISVLLLVVRNYASKVKSCLTIFPQTKWPILEWNNDDDTFWSRDAIFYP